MSPAERDVIRVIVNRNAKGVGDEKACDALMESITRALPTAEVWFSDENTKIDVLVERAVRDGATMLVGGGGDGTINAVASAVVGTDRVLGVLPLGTLNHFAKDLGVPADIEEAIAVLRDGTPSLVDVGEVNDRIFLNNSGLGLYPDIVHLREIRQKHGAAKWPSAIVAAIRALRKYRLLGIRITVDDEPMLRRTPAILVGNNEYTTQNTLEPKRVALDSGKLSLYIPRKVGRWKLIWFSLKALLTNSGLDDGFETLLTDTFTIESHHKKLRVSLDGEVAVMPTPLKYRSRAAELRVIMPTVIR
jgi:diacylglycerol kinase family enzyme